MGAPEMGLPDAFDEPARQVGGELARRQGRLSPEVLGRHLGNA